MLHIQELSAPTFRSRDAVGELLDGLQIAWAPSPDAVFELEVKWAIERAITGQAKPRQVFSASFEQALGAPPEANIPVSEMLEAMSEHSKLRSHLQELATYGALADSHFKRSAAVVRAPDEPILAHIRELNVTTTPAGLTLPQTLSPQEILERVGGRAGLPAHNVSHSLARIRLGDEQFVTTENDVIDELHATYAPYCVAMVLDRGTVARFRATRLPEAARVVHKLSDLPALLSAA